MPRPKKDPPVKTPKKSKEASSSSSGANIGFEAQLLNAADALRSNMDAAKFLIERRNKDDYKSTIARRSVR
ncbi:hypothetical protein HUU59_12200 [bacterium]|nr:hypothetical protein [bacterium]